MTARDQALNAARRAYRDQLGHRMTVDEQIAFAVGLDAARATGAVLYRDDVERVYAAGRELLDAEERYRLSPTLENTSRLARARRAVEEAIGPRARDPAHG